MTAFHQGKCSPTFQQPTGPSGGMSCQGLLFSAVIHLYYCDPVAPVLFTNSISLYPNHEVVTTRLSLKAKEILSGQQCWIIALTFPLTVYCIKSKKPLAKRQQAALKWKASLWQLRCNHAEETWLCWVPLSLPQSGYSSVHRGPEIYDSSPMLLVGKSLWGFSHPSICFAHYWCFP